MRKRMLGSWLALQLLLFCPACSSPGTSLMDGGDGGNGGLDGDAGLDGDTGPDAGDEALGDDGGTGDDGGLSGATFENIAPPGGFVSSIAFHPTDPDIVYAGMDDSGGLFVSHDRGAHWDLVETGKQNWSAWDVAVNPDDPRVITTVDCYGHGVLRSENGGISWQERNVGLALQDPDRRVRALVVDPMNPDNLYIGTGSGVYKSSDGAGSWTGASTGLPDGRMVFRLAVDPDDPRCLYAGLDGGGIYRTLDGAGHWSQVADILPASDQSEVWDLVVAPSNPNWVLAAAQDRVLLTTDGGKVWNPIAVGLFDELGGFPIGVTAAFDPSDELTIYLATFRMNGRNLRLKSTTGGASFEDITGEWGHEGVFRIRVSPKDSNLVIAGMVGDGIEWSADAGQTWHRHAGPPWLATAPSSFAQAPSNPGRIYMHGSFTLARTNDGGKVWERLKAPQTLSYYMAVHPTNPDVVLLAPLFLFSDGVLRSEDGCESWHQRPLNSVAPMQFAFDSSNPDQVYAAGFKSPTGNFGIYKSENQGIDWTRLTPDWWYDTLAPTGVIEHPDRDGKLLATTVNGLYVSDSAQTNFTQLALDGRLLFMVDALAGGLWVAGGQAAAFIKDGDEWIEHDFPGSKVYCVLLDPARPNRVLLGVSAWDKEFTAESATGLYLSEDRGRTFVNLTEDLYPADQIYHLALDRSGPDRYLFSVYSGAGGLYRVHIPKP